MKVATAHDRHGRTVRNWLLFVLRFAITLDPEDNAAVLAMADEIDRLGFVSKRPDFSFFLRTSTELCNAIKDEGYLGRNEILRRHLAKIDEHRLRRAFSAAVGFERQNGLKLTVPRGPHEAREGSLQARDNR